ncbi:hypothetical protein RchiOBHm_Chr2g0095071 [Rosa chinensis]|uniref:Uncharacterized protein n=1 Tax=Rosa chinensis TaxID=74649 RepID=A0A2P6RKP6_ROSCH|nr:hypothetical protein RchiOBHm_Chr2g0095071 [Rosa chinensis]
MYSVVDVPLGIRIVPRSLNEQGEEEVCCGMYETWSDPHLGHAIALRCTTCELDAINHGQNFLNVDHLKASHSAVDADDGKLNHLVVACPECGLTSKVRILRRGREPTIAGGISTPILDVEVIGPFLVNCEQNVDYLYNLYCYDEEDNFCTTQLELQNPDESQNLRIFQAEGDHADMGLVMGFRGRWTECEWVNEEHDRFGLRVMDAYNSRREGYPPDHWRSSSSSSSSEDEEEDDGVGDGGGGGGGGGGGDDDEDEDEGDGDDDGGDSDGDVDDDGDSGGGDNEDDDQY